MKRLSEFKRSDGDYTLLDIQRFMGQVEFENLSWNDVQGMIQDLYNANGLLIDYAARLERGGYGD